MPSQGRTGTTQRLIDRRACAALVVTCSDFRFKSAEREFAVAAGLDDDYDLIARPGAARSFVHPRDDAARTSFEDEVRLLWRLHAFTRVLLLNHVSCRAYDDLVGDDDEVAVHTRHLRAAAARVESLLPAVAAEAYLLESVDLPPVIRRLASSTGSETASARSE